MNFKYSFNINQNSYIDVKAELLSVKTSFYESDAVYLLKLST